jgi:3-hydroxyisobutyrate dehydrogenase-like beta-hydroxyacid dehydrogenase
MTLRVGYIGIGIMGSGIVKNLRKATIGVSFIARDNERARATASVLAKLGAKQVENYAALAAQSDVIMLSVLDSSVVEPLIESDEGIGPHLHAGQIVIDLSTSYPPSTRRLAALLAAREITLLDAPLTGSRKQAEAGTLNVMCGGPAEAFGKAEPLFKAIASHVFHVGPVGSGHGIKLINNYLGQATMAAICETLPFARKYGIDLKAMFDVISVSGGNSAVFQGAMPRLIERDFSVAFQQKFVHKDLRYINQLMSETATPTPLAATLLQIHERAGAEGYGEQDFTALLKYFESLEIEGSSRPPNDAKPS